MGRIVTSDFRHVKCSKKEQKLEDGISQCPDDVLVSILSYLTLEDAARTSVLSKRWVNLWLFVSGLDFDTAKVWKGLEELKYSEYHELRRINRQNYINWVNKVLQSHKATALDVFRIRFDLNNSSRDEIDKWLHYASARNLQSLELNLLRYDGFSFEVREAYAFPPDLLGPSYENPSAPFPDGINSFVFKNLRTLAFKSVAVSGEVVRFFLHNCPFLECLTVNNSHILDKFEVCGPSFALKHLEITDCPKLVSLIVSGANLVSLRFTERAKNSLVIKNVPNLVDLNIVWSPLGFSIGRMISCLCCCLSMLEILTFKVLACDITYDYYEDVGGVVAVPQLTRLKQLTVVVGGPKDESLIPFTSLIRASPNLEKFIVKFGSLSKPPKKRRASWKGLAFPLERLQVVEILGYTGRVTEMELVEYFLENVVALKRIVIDPRDQLRLPTHTNHHPHDNPKDTIYRDLAKQQFQGLLPSEVELVLL
ncbi:OLC1v1010466C4 [Oldenlandia corymbosa var. corymbosa]|uniref:OLC1v1010466C4 n=1 Tax=Oldenlandia corymbosa var. corymbosa TaxID=529605 RepID=A0AAV1DUS3_OLDCO|nr:OLC1v1010466C4 [Oldenlandia corymbosa var. corymbosa]